MKNKNTRMFVLDGKSYKFNFSVFMRVFIVKAAEFNMKRGEHEQFLADELMVSKDAIHNWRNNLNGPSGIDVVQKLAEVWNVDFLSLVREIKEIEKDGMNMMEAKNNDVYVRCALKNVYGAMVDFLEFFEKNNGLQSGDTEEMNAGLRAMANVKLEHIILVLRKEMLDIPKAYGLKV